MALSKSYYIDTRIPTVQILVQKEERRWNYIELNNIQYPSSRVYIHTKLICNQQNTERSQVELKKKKKKKQREKKKKE